MTGRHVSYDETLLLIDEMICTVPRFRYDIADWVPMLRSSQSFFYVRGHACLTI